MLNAYRLLLLLLLLLLFISLSLACRLSFFLVMRRRERKKNIKKIVVSKKKKKKEQSDLPPQFFTQKQKNISSLATKNSLFLSLSLVVSLPRLLCRVKNSRDERERDKDARASFFFEKILFFSSELNFYFICDFNEERLRF